LFSFLKKLTKQEKGELLTVDFNAFGINITLHHGRANPAILSLYQNLFMELVDDNIATLNETVLSVKHDQVYSLLRDERSSLLMLPSIFNGSLEVTHRGFLDQDAKFEMSFILDDSPLFGMQTFGSILRVSNNERYILPESISMALNLISKAHTSKRASDRYIVIEHIQSDESGQLEYKGLKENDFVSSVKNIGIDIVEDEDGDLHINPLISGLESDFVSKVKNTISSQDESSLLLTNVGDNRIMRYVLDEDKLRGAKKILSTATIPKEHAAAFKKNPEAFLPEFNADEIDVSQYRISRIKGLTTEVYVGFFGSDRLETPMSQVLNAGGDLVISDVDIKLITAKIQNLPPEKKNALQEDLNRAQEEGKATIDFDGDECPVDVVAKALKESIFKNNCKQLGSSAELMLDVDHNDESGLSMELVSNNPDDIELNHLKYTTHWQNLLFKPKAHQITALNWMISLYEGKFPGGLLADDMGLGKTFQMISFMNYLYNVRTPKRDSSNQRILIVAPTILLSAWKNEIEKAVIDKSAFKVKIIQGKNEGLVKIRALVKEQKTLDIESEVQNLANNSMDVIDLLRSNIYITTYETLSTYQLAFAQQKLFNFEMSIFDEAQKIKNPSARISLAAKGISANIPFTMIVTGTPIENELRDIWSLFDTFDPQFIKPWKEFRETYVKPLNNTTEHDIETKLVKKISNYMLRRMKKDHLDGLPSKEYKIIEVTMNQAEISEHNNIINGGLHHMEKLQKLRVLSLHPSLVDMGNTIDIMQLEKLTNPNTFFKPSKMHALIELLEKIKNKNEKVLIFIIRHSMQTLLQTALNQYFSINIDTINGKNNNKESVDRKLDAFENIDGFGIMILSPLAAGVGLTITAANHVIHLERHWNPAKEDQASDRVYRIGQEKPVYIYHIIHQAGDLKTFDKGLNQLISNKKALSNGVLIPTASVNDKEFVETFFGEVTEEESWALLSPDEFEIEVMRLFEKAGYRCHQTTKQPTESGTDIIAVKDAQTIAIQCKHTRKKTKQNNTALYQLISEAKKSYPHAKYVAITNYYFNNHAHDLATQQDIILVQLDGLIKVSNDISIIEEIVS
jgi:SNF2 family DNA or RNA helicase/HJR/Mrr/RecB family endonuclease